MTSTEVRPSLSEQIYTEVRNEIATLKLQPGTLLFENALAARYDTSRTPVRKALTRLEQDGLLQVLPQRGARIAPLSRQRITEAQEIRETLELTVIGKAAVRWRPGELRYRRYDEQIRQNLDRQEAASTSGDLLAFTRLDGEFHALFMQVAGNQMLLRIVEQVRVHLMRLRYLELHAMRHEGTAIAQHRQIHRAVQANDSEAAVLLMREHLHLLTAQRDEIMAAHADLFTD